MSELGSLAKDQVSLGPDGQRFPLYPPQVKGVSAVDGRYQYPLEVDYDYDSLDLSIFRGSNTRGLARWRGLLPPIVDSLTMGEGNTPLVDISSLFSSSRSRIYLKDESRNPTASHKDRLNLCAVSAAKITGARGVVAASTGNHGISTAAYAARAGLGCVIFVPEKVSSSYYAAVRAYGAYPVPMVSAKRWEVLSQFVDLLGFAPTSNLTPFHTGHPFGPEGYKTIAYEIYLDLGRAPNALFVPTGYAELLYGLVKGFEELRKFGLVASIPKLFSVEPMPMGPLAKAVETGVPMTAVDAAATRQSSIACTVGGYRGVVALARSGGRALTVSDEQALDAQKRFARAGLWFELSSASALAALSVVMEDEDDGEIVVIGTSSGGRDPVSWESTGEPCASFEEARQYLKSVYSYDVDAASDV